MGRGIPQTLKATMNRNFSNGDGVTAKKDFTYKVEDYNWMIYRGERQTSLILEIPMSKNVVKYIEVPFKFVALEG